MEWRLHLLECERGYLFSNLHLLLALQSGAHDAGFEGGSQYPAFHHSQAWAIGTSAAKCDLA